MADAVQRWFPSARASQPLTVMSTDLNSLANGSSVLSAAISNDAADELDPFVDLELNVDFVSAPTADALVEAYSVIAMDGSNYEDSLNEGRPRVGYLGAFIMDNTTAAQRLTIRCAMTPCKDFKLLLLNKSGQAFPGSGTTVKAFFLTLKSDE